MRCAGPWQASLAVCVVLSASVSVAQTVGDSTGTIEGTVTDRTGAVVPGVRVCLSGAVLMVPRCDESGGDGTYRFPGLQPGELVLTFSLTGFEPAQSDPVRVRLGETTTVIFTIDVAPQRTVVNVEGGARALDRLGTTLGASFTAEQLAALPGARSMGAILAAAPAVLMTRHDVGGNTALAVGGFSAYGFAGFNRPMLEGINVANLNALGFTLDYGSFGEAWVGLGAYGPEWASPGVHTQILTKSGGNSYKGSLYVAVEGERWQARNIDQGQIDRGAAGGEGVPATDANRLDSYHDLNADVGGFGRKDRLWWYASGRDQKVAPWRVTFPLAPIEARAWSVTGKATSRIDDDNRLVMFVQRSRQQQPVKLDGFLLSGETALNVAKESTTEQVATGVVWKVEWNGVATGRLFMEARVGGFHASRAEHPNGEALTSFRFEDRSTLFVTGRNREWSEELQRDQVTGSLSYLARSGPGSHLIKAGGDVVRAMSAQQWTHSYPGDVLHTLQNGAPQEVYLLQTPSRSESGQWWYSGYVSDSWQATSRLTLNLGVRFDRFRMFLPAQTHPAGRFTPEASSFPAVDDLIAWNVLAPRIGASHALGADGRTILKITYGLYWLPPGIDVGFNASPNARVWLERHTWSDGNASGVWDPGEEGTLIERRGGSPSDLLDPDLKLPYVHETTARIEREAGAGVILRAGFVWRGERQQGLRQTEGRPFDAYTQATLRTDPGPDGRLGTGDEGPDILLYDLPPGLDAPTGTIVRNVERSESDYLTWEVAAERSLRGRWSLTASFAHTWNRQHASAYLGQQVRNNEFPLTPNDLIHTDGQGRHVFGVWVAKAFATYDAPWRLRVTPLIRYQSGQPFARTFQVQLPNSGSVRVLAEPVGARRQDNITLLDVRVEREFRVNGSRVGGFLEVFNALNANPEQNMTWSSGASFLRPLNVVPPRVARIGLRLDW